MGNNTRMTKLKAILLITSTALFGCTEPSLQDPADIVFLNGGIYTVDAERSWAEAAAIRDGVIVAVGTNADVQPLVGASTEVFDLAGRMAMPGIHDSHVHPLEGGYEQVYCNLWNAQGVDDIVGTLTLCAKNHEGEWFNAVGLDVAVFGVNGPDKTLLDGIADDKFIFVDDMGGHSALVNDKVLDLVGYDENTPDPPLGVIERRADSNEPSGFVREEARDAIDKLRPARDLATSKVAMRNAVQLMNSYGITSVYDAWIGEHEMQTYQALEQSGELTVRVLGGVIDEGVFEKHSGQDFERVLQGRHNYESNLVSYNSVKIMVDGVFEGETAAVFEPYVTTGELGILNHEPDELKRRVARYYDLGMHLHFHTMGDAGTRAALDAIEFARERGSEEHKELRHTLSHLGLIAPEDMPRFRELNTCASFTMVWGYANSWNTELNIPALGKERVDQFYPIRSVHGAGAVLLGGSDWNYGDLDPLLSIESGITRDNPFGPAEQGASLLSSSEHVDLATMIASYTINGAWQLQAEDVSGSIEVGKRADLIVYDRNLFDVDPYAISEATVDLTIFDGRIVHRRRSE